MKRLAFLVVLLALLGVPPAADAQQAGRVWRIGYLVPAELRTTPFFDAFRQGLRELGYVEGKNFVIESRWAEGKYERLPGLAAELVRLKVDLIVATATPAILAARDATSTIPIVFVLAADPVGQGIVMSVARPGRNLTGLASTAATEIYGKTLALLKETVPEVTRVAILSNPASPFGTLVLTEAKAVAPSLRLQLQHVEARGPEDFESVFTTMTRGRAGALLVVPDAMFLLHRARLADLTAKNRLPAMYGIREHVEAGGLMAYAANFTDLYRRAATYVDKILKGAKPADLPVEQPTKFELVINLKTAKALGLKIPQSILLRADQVIE